MIEKIVDCAIERSITTSDTLLSDEFIYEIVVQKKPCYRSWSPSLKVKLLLNYPDVLEMEVLNLIQDYLSEKSNLLNHEIIHLLQISSDLSQRFQSVLSDHIIQFSSWKLIQLEQSIQQYLRVLPLFESCQQEIEKASFYQVETHRLLDIIRNYIYNGSMLHVSNRRNEVWCLSLTFHRFLWYCVYQLIQWTQNKNAPWTTQSISIG
ncbi:hypothetical protein BD770DRAFT_216310 [Pilaira anomala]|nr:hypothetical protein BD770DRAFT_216310 [Pilaira anomala]